MFYSLRRRLNYTWFNYSNRAAFSTPPLRLDPTGPIVVTQLCRDDIVMYLIAIKTFGERVRPAAVYVLDDGSLSPDDHALVKTHVEGLTVLAWQDYQNPKCPKRGCWERLLAISTLSKSGYIVQLDSDTITLGAISEIRKAIAENRSFVIGTTDNQDFEMMPAAVKGGHLRLERSLHVQNVAEANFDKLADHENMRYVRGCAGFSGFAKASVSQDFIEAISGQMYQAIGDRWNEWGTEQVTSNIIVSNSPDALVLPHPKFCNCTRINDGLTEFIHFIGTCRFSRGTYARYVTAAISRFGT